jgi:uncharacterized OB-fold protein
LFENLEEWVEVGHEGSLETYTIVYKSEPFQIAATPFAVGIIKLDGADTGMVHRLAEIDFRKIRIGMRVKAVFNEERNIAEALESVLWADEIVVVDGGSSDGTLAICRKF